jgi:hypothetical protein
MEVKIFVHVTGLPPGDVEAEGEAFRLLYEAAEAEARQPSAANKAKIFEAVSNAAAVLGEAPESLWAMVWATPPQASSLRLFRWLS